MAAVEVDGDGFGAIGAGPSRPSSPHLASTLLLALYDARKQSVRANKTHQSMRKEGRKGQLHHGREKKRELMV